MENLAPQPSGLVYNRPTCLGKVLFRNFKKSRMRISIVRATQHLCIRGSRITTSRMSLHPQWEDGAGLRLFNHQADNKQMSKLN